MTKGDLLLVMAAICGELPSDLAGEIVGSDSYAAAVITRLKQDGYISVRNKKGCKGYVLKAKGKRYVLEKYGADTGYFLSGAVETSHVKSEIEKRIRLHRMGRAWVFCFKMGIPIFRSKNPELLAAGRQRWGGETAYYGSLEFKSQSDAIKGSRACGLLLNKESGYVVYHSMAQKMKWAKKTERSMRTWAEKLFLWKGLSPPADAVIIGDTMDFMLELLESSGGIRENLYQVDDIYDRYYYMPMGGMAAVQMQILLGKTRRTALYKFLCGILEHVDGRDYTVYAGLDGEGNPVYFCYELEMRHLKRVRQDLGWKKRGSILCLDYQQKALENYFGEGTKIRAILSEKVMEYLQQVEKGGEIKD